MVKQERQPPDIERAYQLYGFYKKIFIDGETPAVKRQVARRALDFSAYELMIIQGIARREAEAEAE